MLENPIVQVSLAEEVYNRVRLAIFQNNYKPGEQLNIISIANMLGVSRQPVKEAINRLAQEGLVEIKQRVGTFVKVLSLKDVCNIMDARVMIELFALSQANITAERIQALSKSVDEMDALSQLTPFDYLAFNEADIQFHRLLVASADNDLLVNMYEQLNAHYVTARAFYANAWHTTFTDYGQHRKLVELLEQGDRTEATKFLEQHIRRAHRQLLKSFEQISSEKDY